MEIGMGIHGEPGVERKKIEPADQIVDEMLARSSMIPWTSRTPKSL
jgi:dihydroxyacetone kinase